MHLLYALKTFTRLWRLSHDFMTQAVPSYL